MFRGKFLQSAVNMYTQRYFCPHPTILMTSSSELLGGTATIPEKRCHEPVPSSPEGTMEDAGGRPKKMVGVWSLGFQSEDK